MTDIDAQLEDLWFGDADPDAAGVVAAKSRAADVARKGLRPFPTAVGQLVVLLNSPELSGAKVEEVVATDPAIAARVLQLANSSAFGGAGSCGSLRQAIVRLGARTLSEMVVEVAVREVYADTSAAGLAIVEHSATVSRAVRGLQRLHRVRGSWAPLAGLLHDVGKLLLLQSGEVTRPSADSDDGVAAERAELGFDHAILSALAARVWGLPEPLPEILGAHHEIARAFAAGGEVATTVSLLRVAEDLVVTVDEPSPERLARIAAAPHWAWLGLGPSDALDGLDLLADQGLVEERGPDWKAHIERSRLRWQTRARAL